MGCGGSAEPWVNPEDSPESEFGTALIELELLGLENANYAVGEKPNGFTPIKFNVKRSACDSCFCYTMIPSGFFVKVNSCSKDEEDFAEPGGRCLMPWQNIKMMTKMRTNFDAPVKDAPSADRIPVRLDVSFTFSIEDAQKMLHSNASNVTSSLRTKQEAAVREIVSGHTADKILDMQGSDVKYVAENLTKDLLPQFGIRVDRFIIKEVILPQETMARLATDTVSKLNTSVELKRQEIQHDMAQIQNKLQRAKEEGTAKKNTQIAESETQKQRINADLTRIQSETNIMLQRKVQETQEQVNDIENSAKLEVARIKTDTDEIARGIQAQRAEQQNELLSEKAVYVREKDTELAEHVSKARAEAQELIGKAEGTGAVALANERKHEQDQAQLRVFEKLARNRKMRIAGTAELNARGLTFNDDKASQFVSSALRYATTKFAEGIASAPLQQPLLS